ncbi:MAG TPA: hypothetical protein VNK44_03275 [Candidatus Nitrosotenuis sp.]|nr:hypothetical protein [Candidatus Nitrosotenuis sp.]
MDNSDLDKSRFSMIEVIESFIEKINSIRITLLAISISGLILAPFAIGMSAYLITHPHFFFVLDEYDEFGVFLSVSLGIVIVVSLVWLVLGIRQYLILKSWNRKYINYIRKKKEVDDEISSQFELDDDQNT